MRTPSDSPCRGCNPPQGLLLTVLLLTFWNLPTTAQPSIKSTPFHVSEGSDVLLLVQNLTEDLLGFHWYKGEAVVNSHLIAVFVIDTQLTIPGPENTDRMTVYPNGSLLLQNVTQNDTGVYTIQTVDKILQTQQASGQFIVYLNLPKPFIRSNNSNPIEGEDSVTLTCEPQAKNTAYLWKINGRNLPHSDRLALSNGNRTLTLFRVRRNDTGPYECETWSPVNVSQSDPVTLTVFWTNLTLFCYAASMPASQFSWLINGRTLKSTQELFIPKITPSNSGSYSCLVHNSATGLSKMTVKNIIVSEPVTRPSLRASSTTVAEKDSVTLTCLSRDIGTFTRWIFKDQTLQLTERMKLSQDHKTLTIDPVRKEDTGQYQCEVSNPVSSSKSDPIRLTIKYGPLLAPPVNQVPQPVLQSTNPNVTVGDIIILSCIPHTTGVTIRWIFNNRELWILKNIFMSDDHHILAINPVRKQNAGEYQCEVSTPAGSSRSATIKVSVQ
ncbi:cell adhesion molecule CEACAM6-like [Ctenodactylus gundi]